MAEVFEARSAYAMAEASARLARRNWPGQGFIPSHQQTFVQLETTNLKVLGCRFDKIRTYYNELSFIRF